MREKPYIGVTGPSNLEDTQFLLKFFKEAGVNMETDHIPMIGILISDRTLQGEHNGDLRYPYFEYIPEMLYEIDEKAFSTIHYNTKNKENLSEEILDLVHNLGSAEVPLGGFQFNIHWPPIEEIAKIKRALSDKKLILSLSKTTMDGKTPKELGRRVA
ncbi:hypothetical protein JXA85_02180, partial [Candidatus Woesearchaeota archaeon]|nr:hypothetical protein [Candidatus Woesearchaeota archaeon]